MREKDGEVIYMVWDGRREAYYIKGHVSLEYATEVLEREEEYTPDNATHKFAKWVLCNHKDFKHQLNVYDTPRRGAFKVTECECK
jgi:hypothetical protein